MQFVAAKYHKNLISTAICRCPATENGKVQVTTWLLLTQHLVLNAAQYKVSCNNCTKVNNSFVGAEKSIVLEKNTSSTYDEKSN
jgi:hypothetical protein